MNTCKGINIYLIATLSEVFLKQEQSQKLLIILC